MRKILFDKEGDAIFYLTGAGVLYDLSNQAVGRVQREAGIAAEGKLEPVSNSFGAVVAWFDDWFLWTVSGDVIAFVKGAEPEGELQLPKTKKLAFVPQPVSAPFVPLLLRGEAPERNWVWAVHKLVLTNQEFYT